MGHGAKAEVAALVGNDKAGKERVTTRGDGGVGAPNNPMVKVGLVFPVPIVAPRVGPPLFARPPSDAVPWTVAVSPAVE